MWRVGESGWPAVRVLSLLLQANQRLTAKQRYTTRVREKQFVLVAVHQQGLELADVDLPRRIAIRPLGDEYDVAAVNRAANELDAVSRENDLASSPV